MPRLCFLVFLLLIASSATSLTGCKPVAKGQSEDASEESSAQTASAAKQPEQPFKVSLRVWPQTVRVQGSLLGDEQATISSKIAGKVQSVAVDLGDVVRAGDPLVMLETHELQLRVNQAEAQLAQACAAVGMTPAQSEDKLDPNRSPAVRLEKALLDEARINLKRIENLVAQRATSQQEAERLETLVRTAEARHTSALNGVQEKIALIRLARAELALAQQSLADAKIVAPFDAVVHRRQTAPGEYLQASQPVVTLVRVDTLRFTAGVPERSAAAILRGQPLQIYIEGHETPVAATITRISPALDLASRSLMIEADVPNPGHQLRSGLFAEGDIVVDPQAQVLAVPATAVTEFAGVEKVWVMQDGKREERSVRTGRTEGGFVEILAGLDAGDVVLHAEGSAARHTAKDATPDDGSATAGRT